MVTGKGNTGGTVPIDSSSYTTTQAAVVLNNTGSLEKTDYTFAGWNTQEDGKGIDYAAGDFLNISGNITLYAKWTEAAATYTLNL